MISVAFLFGKVLDAPEFIPANDEAQMPASISFMVSAPSRGWGFSTKATTPVLARRNLAEKLQRILRAGSAIFVSGAMEDTPAGLVVVAERVLIPSLCARCGKVVAGCRDLDGEEPQGSTPRPSSF
jgi:hypothetical protein